MSDLKKVKIFAGVVLGVMIGASILITQLFMKKEFGDFDIGLGFAIAGSMIGGVLISHLLSIWKEKRNGNIPEIDERTIFVMKNYFMWAFYFVLIGSAIVTFVLYFSDVKTVEIGLLFVYQMIIYIFVGTGAFVAKKIG